MKTKNQKPKTKSKPAIQAPAPIGVGKRAYKTNKALGGTFRWEAETEEAVGKLMFTLNISKSDAVRYAIRIAAAGI